MITLISYWDWTSQKCL